MRRIPLRLSTPHLSFLVLRPLFANQSSNVFLVPVKVQCMRLVCLPWSKEQLASCQEAHVESGTSVPDSCTHTPSALDGFLPLLNSSRLQFFRLAQLPPCRRFFSFPSLSPLAGAFSVIATMAERHHLWLAKTSSALQVRLFGQHCNTS